MSLPSLETITEDLALFEDWEDKYAYLIELGQQLPVFPEDKRTEAYKVRGCTSQVWLVQTWDDAGCLQLQADSDAVIVKGLVALVLAAYSGKTRAEVAVYDLTQTFEELGLSQHLTVNRRNGFSAMVAKIKAFAA